LGAASRRVLLTVGRKDLAPFAARPWHAYVIRSVDPPGAAAPLGAEILLARGPFEPEAERRLLEERRIEVIVTKNSGGTATQAKLLAARRLRLPVIMVERPPPPAGESVADAAAAAERLTRLHQAALDPRGAYSRG
jgi:precorrin-6A/cobalt-precorrin-6A reductase